ncbi:MAG: CsgG/HfaB family protein [Bacteroidales bacterium]|jgi:hypothetical protein|nr:CsgG/HfaB family protein [Bacteroidales bacterium]
MKKYLIVLWAFLLILPSALAQQEKLRVAVLDPSVSGTSVDAATRLAVQELISSTFVNTGKYVMIERSMIDKIMKEQEFQNSDMADNSQATELGKLVGANKVVLSAVSSVSGRNMLSIKIIDVQTATIDQQKTKIVNVNDLLDVVEPLTLELLGEEAVYKKQETQFIKQEVKPKEDEVKKIIFEGKPKKDGEYYLKDYSMQVSIDGEVLENGISAISGFSLVYRDKKPEEHVLKVLFTSSTKRFTSSIAVNTALYDKFVFQIDADYYKASLTLIQTFNSNQNKGESKGEKKETAKVEALSPQIAGEGELSLYCAGFTPSNDADRDISIIVKLDGKLVANSTLIKGFSTKVEDTKIGKHKIQINEDDFKIDTKKKKDFIFIVKKEEATKGSTISVGFIPIQTKGKSGGYKFELLE